MESIWIEGGHPLKGAVRIQGSKNAVLPILAATLLIHGETVLHHCPHITDIDHMINLLRCVGCKIHWEEETLRVDASDVSGIAFPREDVDCMRSSIMLLGPMLQRMGEVLIHYPGGCVIGKRPVDVHIRALKQLGAQFLEDTVFIHARSEGFVGAGILLPIVSVGVTENLILSAVLAKGTTRIYPAAKEPEIVALCSFLQSAGAHIKGAGSDEIIIEGVSRLFPTEYSVMADRIVAGTYLFAAHGCGGEVELMNAPVGQLYSVLQTLSCLGAGIETDEKRQWIRLCSDGRIKSIPYIETAVYPGFPTDLQSSLIVALSRADGISVVTERIFENRFRILPAMRAMGACIRQKGSHVTIAGVEKLTGCNVEAMELRGGAALTGAGLMAEGITEIDGVGYIRRGYEDIVKDFRQLGAVMEWKQHEE